MANVTVSNVTPSRDLWWARLLVGIVLIVIGIALLFSLRAAAVTLAWLIGFGLILHGIYDLFTPISPRWLGIAGGVISIGAGVISIAWPSVTLLAIAIVTGIAFVLIGLVQMAAAWSARESQGWTWLLAAGGLSVALGVVSLAWPEVTVFVLALLLALRTLSAGIVEVALALTQHREHGMPMGAMPSPS